MFVCQLEFQDLSFGCKNRLHYTYCSSQRDVYCCSVPQKALGQDSSIIN